VLVPFQVCAIALPDAIAASPSASKTRAAERRRAVAAIAASPRSISKQNIPPPR